MRIIRFMSAVLVVLLLGCSEADRSGGSVDAKQLLKTLGASAYSIVDGSPTSQAYALVIFDPSRCVSCARTWKSSRVLVKHGWIRLIWIPVSLTDSSVGLYQAATILSADDPSKKLEQHFIEVLSGLDRDLETGASGASIDRITENSRIAKDMGVAELPLFISGNPDHPAIAIGPMDEYKLESFLFKDKSTR